MFEWQRLEEKNSAPSSAIMEIDALDQWFPKWRLQQLVNVFYYHQGELSVVLQIIPDIVPACYTCLEMWA